MMATTTIQRTVFALLIGIVVGWTMASRAADAQTFELDLPIRCTVGEDCWIVNYVDLNPGEGVSDYRCGVISYDGHKGTDIAIRDHAVMSAGVPVLAAAAGRVERVRDGMDDIDVALLGGREAVKGRECGNGIVVSHPGGWTTQYCHLRKGSTRVKTGDWIKAGQEIALVGNSGFAHFPHVHLQIAKDGKIVDPFVGVDGWKKCGLGTRPLWKRDVLAKLDYRPTALYNAGFAATTPKADAVRSGLHDDKVLSRQAPALVLWVDIFWVKPGDQLTLRILGPDGATVVEHTSKFDRLQARRLAYAGVKRKKLFWDGGTYRGEIRLLRDGAQGREEFTTMREITIK
jgi:murein DD-endopeptidase MepM/ murein hydrolase activator NlpD